MSKEKKRHLEMDSEEYMSLPDVSERINSLKGRAFFVPIYPQIFMEHDEEEKVTTITTNVMSKDGRWGRIKEVVEIPEPAKPGAPQKNELFSAINNLSKAMSSILYEASKMIRTNFSGTKLKNKPFSFDVIDRELSKKVSVIDDAFLSYLTLSNDEVKEISNQAEEMLFESILS